MPTALQHGELLYELKLSFTQIAEYGIGFADILTGAVTAPPEGARFDAHVAGTAKGPRIDATVDATDYLIVRADGKFILHIHGTLTASTGETIAMHIPGQGFMESDGLFYLREMVDHHTSHEAFKWLNMMNCFVEGWANPATGELEIKAYAVK